MRMVFRRSAVVEEEPRARALDMYDFAFLAGGARRVADCALIALSQRGLLKVRASRVQAVGGNTVGGEQPGHPVERAVLASCPRSRNVVAVHTALQRSPEIEEIGRRLATEGLVSRSRHRLTRAGRRQLRTAERDRSRELPTYVFDGPAVLPDGPVRRGVGGVQPIPSGLGRALIRMGKALERDSDSISDSDSGGGFSCGGGGGGD